MPVSSHGNIWKPIRSTRVSTTVRYLNLKRHKFTVQQKNDLCAAMSRYKDDYDLHVANREAIIRAVEDGTELPEFIQCPKNDQNGINMISQNAASSRYGIPRRTVRAWFQRWQEYPDGLHEGHRRPFLLT